jgi:hypothetical protein
MCVRASRAVDGEFANLHVNYAADTTLTITLEFSIAPDRGPVSISEYATDVTALELARRITAIEIAVLAHELNSPAETVDYWMTNEQYRQSEWADTRNASRQTVNDRVQAARSKLGDK